MAANLTIFFDLDGTLIDISARHYRVYSDLVNEFSGSPLSRRQYWGLKRQKTPWSDLLSVSHVPVDRSQEFLVGFISKIEDPKYLNLDTLFPETLSALNALSQVHECYLVSLRRRKGTLLQQLEQMKLSRYFIEILTGHSEADGYDVKIDLIKPHLSSHNIIVGDTEADIVTGKKLGLETVAVTSGIRSRQFLSNLHPDHLIPSVAGVGTLL